MSCFLILMVCYLPTHVTIRYPALGIQPLTVNDLECLSSLEQIDGYLAVIDTPLTNLSFLRSVKRIYGMFSPNFQGKFSVYISGNAQLTSLSLQSLKLINYGSVVVRRNAALCNNIAWGALLRNPSSSVPPFQLENIVSQSSCGTFKGAFIQASCMLPVKVVVFFIKVVKGMIGWSLCLSFVGN